MNPPSDFDFEAEALLTRQLNLLGLTDTDDNNQLNSQLEEIRSTPLFSGEVAKLRRFNSGLTFPQFGLLAGRQRSQPATHTGVEAPRQISSSSTTTSTPIHDPRIFLNVNAPWSAFICGSQGSGKSHSLSCMIENCLIPNPVLGLLPNPLTALVFHYDSFTSSAGGQVSEAAYLCSSGMSIRVLVSPTNLAAMRALYTNIPGLPPDTPRPTVKPFFLDQKYLNVDRLMTLMAAGTSEGAAMPLYMQSALQILREMAMNDQKQQQSSKKQKPGIDYALFKKLILSKDLSPGQLAPLSLRLGILESFIGVDSRPGGGETIDWSPIPGTLTIVDLSCPFVDPDTACGLFEMCLGVYLEQKMEIGRLIVLDEAHKVMFNFPSFFFISFSFFFQKKNTSTQKQISSPPIYSPESLFNNSNTNYS